MMVYSRSHVKLSVHPTGSVIAKYIYTRITQKSEAKLILFISRKYAIQCQSLTLVVNLS